MSDRFKQLNREALALNSALPRDVWLKGDGTFWIKPYGNKDANGRPATQEEILKLLYMAIEKSGRMISI
jgi:hypothetical protein